MEAEVDSPIGVIEGKYPLVVVDAGDERYAFYLELISGDKESGCFGLRLKKTVRAEIDELKLETDPDKKAEALDELLTGLAIERVKRNARNN